MKLQVLILCGKMHSSYNTVWLSVKVDLTQPPASQYAYWYTSASTPTVPFLMSNIHTIAKDASVTASSTEACLQVTLVTSTNIATSSWWDCVYLFIRLLYFMQVSNDMDRLLNSH